MTGIAERFYTELDWGIQVNACELLESKNSQSRHYAVLVFRYPAYTQTPSARSVREGGGSWKAIIELERSAAIFPGFLPTQQCSAQCHVASVMKDREHVRSADAVPAPFALSA